MISRDLRSLPEALFGHAAAAPHRPAVFFPHGWDWRWISWREAAARVDAAAGELAEGAAAELPPGPQRLAFAGGSRPEAWLLDLAVQASGHLAVPMGLPEEPEMPAGQEGSDEGEEPDAIERLGRRLEEVGAAAWVEGPEGPGLPEAVAPHLPRLHLDTALAGGKTPDAPLPTVPPEVEPGGVVVREESGRWREISAAELAAAAVRLDGVIRPSGARRPRREVVVGGAPLDDPGERLLISWALAAGAALALAPSAAARSGIASWVRPTVFRGDAAELGALAAAARAYRPPPFVRLVRRLRGLPPPLPFSRLHTVLPCAPEPEEEALDFWRRSGVQVSGAMKNLGMPQCGKVG